MKLITLFIATLFFNVAFAQEDTSRKAIDTLIERQTIYGKQLDSLNEKREKDARVYNDQISKAKNVIKLLSDETSKSKTQLIQLDEQKQKLTFTLDSLVKELDKRSAAYDTLNKIQKNISDSIKNEIDTLKNTKAEVAKTNQDLNAKAQELISQIAKKEDSAHVIAVIKLKSDVKGENYQFGIYVDGRKIIKKLNEIHDSTNRNYEKNKRFRKDNAKKVLDVFGSKGFRFYDDAMIDKIIDLKLWNDTIPLDKKYTSYSRKSIKVEEVRINVFEGMIREISVKTTYGVFRNLKGPIDLVNIGKRLDDRLYRDGEKMYEDEYLVLGEVIEYIPVRSNNDLPYTQFDITLTPDTPKHVNDTYWIEESTGINTYFDVAIFSDIKGLSGDANGLAQTMASAKFITNTRNFKDKALIPLNFVSFIGGLSKFDNEFKGTKLESGDSIKRKDLLQRSNYYAGLKLNLLHWILSPKPTRLIQDIQLNAGYNFVGSKTLKITANGPDSIRSKIFDSAYTTVTHNMVYFEPIVSLNRYRNFNMAVSLPFYFINLKESSGIANRKMEYWARPSIELMYFSKRNSSSKIFFRYNHWINLKKKENAFVQMQLGYSANLGDLFKSE